MTQKKVNIVLTLASLPQSGYYWLTSVVFDPDKTVTVGRNVKTPLLTFITGKCV